MNFLTALKITNFVQYALKVLNRAGTSLPGKVLSKIYPNFLIDCQNYVTSYKYAVTGTNGKTTTAGLLAQILKYSNKIVVHNELGANMPNGVVTAIAEGLYKNFKKNGVGATVDNFVIESDEAYLQQITKSVTFDYLLVTNLFRDQLDRYGELDITKKKIQEGIRFNPNLKLVLNADDPGLFGIDENIVDDYALTENQRQKIYFGFNNIIYKDYEENSNSPTEHIYCPRCSEILKYSKRYYSQLGDWYCSCGLKRPKLTVGADIELYRSYSILKIQYKDINFEIKLGLSGLYNAYNALGAIACALSSNIGKDVIKLAIENYKPAFGRQQHEVIQGKPVVFYLIKNPVGASEVLRGLKNLQNSKIFISINDNFADGRDVSWLWDADFEALGDFNNKIFITGSRADDMALRLKYAGFNPSNMVIGSDIKKTFDYALNSLEINEKLVVLPTYTSLLTLNKTMKK